MTELISVIVPVYNVEPYLKKCIDSLLNQTYSSYEVILVDDGSKDRSGLICDSYAQKYKKVTALHKKNGGLSDARNFGICHANGNYLIFVDGDDFVNEQYIERLYSLVSEGKADIGICDVLHYYGDDEILFEKLDEVRCYSAEEAISCMLYQKDFLVTACAKIFPKKCFSEISFPVGMLFEDSAVMYRLFDCVEKIAYNPSKIYAYVHRENSITTKQFTKRDCDILKICKDMEVYLQNKHPRLTKAMTAYYTSSCLRIYLNTPNDTRFMEEREFCKGYLRQNGIKTIKDKNARKKNKYALALFYISPAVLRRVYKHVDRWK